MPSLCCVHPIPNERSLGLLLSALLLACLGSAPLLSSPLLNAPPTAASSAQCLLNGAGVSEGEMLERLGAQLGSGAAFAWVLRRCGSSKALSLGKQVHALLIQSGIERDVFLGNLLVQMYGKCGAVEDARAVFGRMHQRNVFSWTIMIAACVEHGLADNGLQLFRQMLLDEVAPNKVTFVCVLSACASQGCLSEGKRMHSYVVVRGLEGDRVVGTALVNMYGKCGSLEDARMSFSRIRKRDVVSWNTMMGAYVQHGHAKGAFQLFQQMQLEGVIPDKVTFISILSACANQTVLGECKRMHACVVCSGFESDITVGNALVNMYGKCGSLEDARRVFHKMPERNVVSWNTMISAYAQQGRDWESFQLFQQMQDEGLMPDAVTLGSMLFVCATGAELSEGRKVHSHIMSSGFQMDVAVGNALVNMYGKCGSLEDARRIFDKMPERNVVSWNAMIASYIQHGQGKKAFQFFQQMQLHGVIPDKFTFASILSGCAGEAALTEGKLIHARIVEHRFESDVVVGNALINIYGKCGNLGNAWRVFDKMLERDIVSWNAIITAYAQNGYGKEALQLFKQMQLEGSSPDKVTLIATLSACASQACLAEGKQMHSLIVCQGLESDINVGNALVNMYGKCGSLEDAWRLFDKMSEKDCVSWNAMISACAWHGHGKQAFSLFQLMQLEGAIPDKVTFVIILSGFSHAGLVDEGCQCFVSMGQGHGIIPTVEHYNCMIDLLGRAGQLDEGEELIGKMCKPTAMSWLILLGACRKHFDVERGRRAAEHVFVNGS